MLIWLMEKVLVVFIRGKFLPSYVKSTSHYVTFHFISNKVSQISFFAEQIFYEKAITKNTSLTLVNLLFERHLEN